MRFKFPIVSCDLKLFQLDTEAKVQFSTSQILIFLLERHDHVALSKIPRAQIFNAINYIKQTFDSLRSRRFSKKET